MVRNNHIGDLVCTLPAFEALRHGLPRAHITAIVNPISSPLLNNHPHVDDVKFDDELDPVDQLAGILRQGRFDAVLVLWCSRRNAYAAFKARVPIRVTHGRRWVQALCGTHRCYLSRKKPPYHESAFMLSFIQRLGIPFTLEQARPYLYVDPARTSEDRRADHAPDRRRWPAVCRPSRQPQKRVQLAGRELLSARRAAGDGWAA